MNHFTPWASTFGGVLIGLASAGLLLWNRRIAGISGIVGNLLSPVRGDVAWRIVFVLGLVAAGLVAAFVAPSLTSTSGTLSLPWLAVSGLLVGFGSRLGCGCTSGHGVCGLGRFSLRSLCATLTFMATAGLTVFVLRHLLEVH